MPLLASMLLGCFTALVNFLARYLTVKMAVFAATFTAFAGLFAVMWVAIVAILDGIAMTVPSGFDLAFYVAVPDVGPACFSALIATHTAIGLYKVNVKVLTVTTTVVS